MSTEIKAFVNDQIGTIVFNRPESRNAFTLEMLEKCSRILAAFRDDPDVRVIVLTGAGESFCSGGDVKKMGRSTSVIQRKSDLWKRMQTVPKMLATVDKPVIAMINGDAVGGGMDIALMCDIRVASERARFSQAYVRLGLVPGDGGAFFLARLIGLGRALEILLTADFVDAPQAERIGLVNHCVPHHELEAKAVSPMRAFRTKCSRRWSWHPRKPRSWRRPPITGKRSAPFARSGRASTRENR